MYEILILGFLQEGEKHGYQLKHEADKHLAGICEFSYGSLYPKFKTLEAKGFITSKSSLSEGGQEKIFYQITESGYKYFLDVMTQEKKESFQSAWMTFQVKVLFFEFIEKSLVSTILINAENLLNEHINRLESFLSLSPNLNEYKKDLVVNNLKNLKNNFNWVKSINITAE
ncbi:MAG: PadR family transcriptional regulator [Cyanobacteriota bacterium]